MRIAVFLFFLFFSTVLFGQGYLVHTYSEAEGLPSANVYGITQDHMGRMWFATRAGIAVYDGVSMETYTMSDDLPAFGFFKITVDQKGRVWALSETGLSKIFVVYHNIRGKNNGNKRARWITIKKPKANINKRTLFTSFRLIEQKSSDKPIVAIGTTLSGLFLWNAFNRGKWINLTKKDGLLSNTVNGIVALNGKCYLVTDQGLSIIKPGKNSSIDIDNGLNQTLGLPSEKIKGICIERKDKFPDFPLKNSRVWLFGHQWLGYFDESDFKMTCFPARSSIHEGAPIVNMLPDYRGGVYIGTRYNLSYFNYKTQSQEVMDMGNGLIGTGAHSIFIDYEKNMWFVCDRGVSKISSRRFATFQRVNGLLEDEVTAIVEYEPGKFVLGHNYGITLYDGDQFTKLPFFKRAEFTVSSNRVLDIKVDSKKNLWLAVSFAGLAKLNPRQPREITWYGKKNHLSGQVMCIGFDRGNNDSMWVGTNEGLFFLKKNETKSAPRGTEQFVTIFKKSVRKIYTDPEELLYIGTGGEGVYVYTMKNQQRKNARVPGNQRANSIYAIKKDSNGRLLIGTLAGLYIMENQTLKKFTVNGFQVDRPVYFILEDPGKQLWFGTDNGVIRWDGKKQRAYTAAQGLIGNETNRGAGIIDSKGKIWIGTNRSVSIYDQQFDNSDAYSPAPRVQLLSIELSDGQIPLKTNTPIRLSYENNTMVFHFRGISFMDEGAIRFKNKLEGFEKEWSRETYPYKQMIQYTNLPPGTYRFHLKARNMLGAWSDVVSSARIIIMPPFYRTWWFLLLVVLLVGGIFYGIFRFISQKRYAALLEKQVEERTQQLEAAHQQLMQAQKMQAIGTLAGGIAHDFNNILAVIMGKAELIRDDLPPGNQMRSEAETIVNVVERGAELVKQILTFSRQRKSVRKPIKPVNIIKDSLSLLRSILPSTIEIRQDIRVTATCIMADAAQIRQIVMNFGTNAAHAMREQGGVLEVKLEEISLDARACKQYDDIKPGNYLELLVSDTGHGMPAEVIKRIFEPYFTTKKTGEGTGMGLAVAHGIVKSYGGDISVHSEMGKGTTFRVLLPCFRDTEKKQREAESQPKEEIPGGTERILLVDDEAELTEAAKKILEKLGYHVVGKSSSIEALSLFKKAPLQFDIVISDLTMPHMTGLQLAREIKRIRIDIPFVLLSGYSLDMTREQVHAFGVSEFISKPINRNKLARVVRRVLDRRHKTEDR
ncbi:MAG: two-component regulator propeller domain-containing protein [Candidatus Aminicenantes bacterium]|jgi:signal transduction histidine kinase/ligand-binding sensor domain-containing protein/CheY-like chemotaxis protein